MLQKNIFWTVALFLFPMTMHAQVLLSEIAWMGTDDDANNEWIEIYNFSNTPTTLTGWTLTSDDGAVNIALSGTLPPHGVAVLERTDDETLPSVTALLTYTGGLSNEGRTLTLKDATGATADQAVGGTNWTNIGGDNTIPKKTAQRNRAGAWVTAAPTPGAQNAEVSDPVPTPADTQEVTSSNSTAQSNGGTSVRRSGGGSSSKKASNERQSGVLNLAIDAPTVAYVNQPVTFTVEPSGVGSTIMNSLKYEWNFGDLHTATSKTRTHTFAYPGEYIVHASGAFAKQQAHARHEITVLPAALTLSRNAQHDLVVTNVAPYEMDVSGFVVRGAEDTTFPEHSFIKSKGSITIPAQRVGMGSAMLHDRGGVSIATYGISAPMATKSVSTPKITYQVVTPEVDRIPTQIEEVSVPEETVIAIGNDIPEVEPEGFFRKILRSIGSLFGS